MRKTTPSVLAACSAATLLLASAGGAVALDLEGLTPIQELGRQIFFDKKLSIRENQACATCHVPEAGWVGNDSQINLAGAVYEGSIKQRFGDRKPPSSAYATLAPIFYADFGNRLLGDNVEEFALDPLFVGGNFWDGRATGWELGNPAADQAQGPFLNPVEQALPDAACVVYRVCDGKYGGLFREVWGPDVCTITWPRDIKRQCKRVDGTVSLSPADRQRVDRAYDRVALAVAAFEGSAASNAFTSKIDAHRAGVYEFTAEEELGRRIFQGKGKCVNCHVGAGGPGAPAPLFTDFTYDNLGVPKNPLNPFLLANPDFRDPGLAGFLGSVSLFEQFADANRGKHKVPTLRNVALGSCEAEESSTAAGAKSEKEKDGCFVKAYTHNGYFKSLKQVVHFYNTRDVKPVCPGDYTADEAIAADCWPAPEVADNVNTAEMGNLGLSEAEEDALVAFMKAMSDGYWVK